MDSKLKFIVTFLISILCSVSDQNLKSIVIVARHGARNPYSSVAYYDFRMPYARYGIGELTPIGMRQHYLLGKYLREQYGSYLGDKYNSSIISVRTTNYNRTIMSEHSLLLGLFPSNEEKINMALANQSNLLPPWTVNVSSMLIQQLNDSAIYKDIPLFVINNNDINNESSISYLKACNYIQRLYDQAIESDNYTKIVKKYDDTLQKFFKILNIDSQEFYKLNHQVLPFTDAIITQNLHNTLPSTITDDMVLQIANLREEIFLYQEFSNNDVQKLSNNEFRKEIVDIFQTIINNTSNIRASIFLTHDYGVMHILNMLYPDLKVVPNLAASIIFELISTDNKSYQVNIIYNGNKLSTFNFEDFQKTLMDGYIKKQDYLNWCNKIPTTLKKKLKIDEL